ncbi:hypothetical protein I4U23_008982 [Adineta vaga]|nr:hypothetical protein I4U23_008982 [Adineta vaga]
MCCNRKPKISSIPTNPIIHSHPNIELTDKIITKPEFIDQISSDIDLDRLTEQYLERINEYRFQLGFSPLEFSDKLTNRALQRALELSRQNYIETSDRSNLMFNDEPIE